MNNSAVFGWGWTTAAALLLAWAQVASSQTFSSGSTGADGAFNPTANQNITVRQGGVHHYTTVNIPVGVTVQYVRNTDNAPVTILATGDVTIAGTIIVSGNNSVAGATTADAPAAIGASGGPGGFSGGNGGVLGGVPPTTGHGPGGGPPSTGAGGHGGSYGAPSEFVTLIPLFGGSGGGGGNGIALGFGAVAQGNSGAGGGGAILVASSTRINITGQIRANGGNTSNAGCSNAGSGAGAGGAIRLVAPEITGAGNVQAIRGSGNCVNVPTPTDGRIRLEAFNLLGFTGTAAPVPSIANAPGPVSPAGNPALANVPTLAIASIGGNAVPSTTGASYFAPDMTLAQGTPNPVPVVITATNTPVGPPTAITVRLIPQSPGSATNIPVPGLNHTGTFATSTANVDVTFPVGQVSVIHAFAAMTLTGQTASLFPLIDGEPVERVMVAASPGEPSTVSLVTKSGKEARLDQLRLEDQIRFARAWDVLRETRTE